ncbi:chaperone protein DnaJ-like [Panicum miliaceum]|uniref:Chaperone protein DnaJ-like n=1 Tax=Panicum miliaceum TaxID=4540 RepID=A0A3L6SZ79_PANMI|nr:chaperone protein DnaJ-like [Panicum miliaceum]
MAGGGSGKATYYAVLGVARDASAAEIRSAWRRLSLKWHPDKLKGAEDHSRLKEQAMARYHEIQEAYKVLSDPSRKAMYDAALLMQQRFDAAQDGSDERSLITVQERPGGSDTETVDEDELSDKVHKIEIKSSSSSARTGRPASGRIDLFFTFTPDDDAGTSRGAAAGPRNARCPRCAGSSSAPRRRAAPRKMLLQKMVEASRLRFDRKD